MQRASQFGFASITFLLPLVIRCGRWFGSEGSGDAKRIAIRIHVSNCQLRMLYTNSALRTPISTPASSVQSRNVQSQLLVLLTMLLAVMHGHQHRRSSLLLTAIDSRHTHVGQSRRDSIACTHKQCSAISAATFDTVAQLEQLRNRCGDIEARLSPTASYTHPMPRCRCVVVVVVVLVQRARSRRFQSGMVGVTSSAPLCTFWFRRRRPHARDRRMC